MGVTFGKWEPREARLAAPAEATPEEARSFTLELVADQRVARVDPKHPRGSRVVALHEGKLRVEVDHGRIYVVFTAVLESTDPDAISPVDDYTEAVDVRSTVRLGPTCEACDRDALPWIGKESRDLRPKLYVEQRKGFAYAGARVSLAACRCLVPLDAGAPLKVVESLVDIVGAERADSMLALCGNSVPVDAKTLNTIRDLREFLVAMLPMARGTTRMA